MSTPPASLLPERYYDKVLGGWIGKCAGGILGAPIEGYKRFNRIELSDELFANNFPNDDLDLQVLWLDLAAKLGPYVRRADLAAHWRKHVDFPWNEYGIATYNLKLGLDPPDSGRHNNRYWAQSMGSPIRSEIWGMLYPGDPERAAFFARMDSELDHAGFSVDAECMLSACAALAFVEDDVETIVRQATAFVPKDSICRRLIDHVSEWYDRLGFETAAARIKSYYGDADFTSAPMNVGFTLLSILHAREDFDRVIKALHLGHDSDCVVATAGAVLGIVRGADTIPDSWRRRVGNELLISPEVSGIRIPKTLTELTEWTCEVGWRIAAGWPAPDRPFALDVGAYEQPDRLKVYLENLTDGEQVYRYRITSDYLTDRSGELSLAAGVRKAATVAVEQTGYPERGNQLPYTLEIETAGRTYTFQRGIPTYGQWLLLGPFIHDAPRLEPLDESYPDHGLASLPSVRYMNHDRVNVDDDEFLPLSQIDALLRSEPRDDRPFATAVLRPSSLTVDLGNHFVGRGERTLYLATLATPRRVGKYWLCLGSTAYLTAWVNGREVLRHRRLARRWPGTAVAEIDLREGENTIVLRLDTVIDDYSLDVGFKDHLGRHHHQSHWTTDLALRVPETISSPVTA